ncbi:MAG: hypothetical protein LBV06_04110 [Propionibacteriaceae bacterium]|nr:hypothetical protein [Propionibacteriaceae bacterium]
MLVAIVALSIVLVLAAGVLVVTFAGTQVRQSGSAPAWQNRAARIEAYMNGEVDLRMTGLRRAWASLAHRA